MSILALAVFAVYFQTVGYPWIHLDDYKHVFENPLILQPSIENLLQFWKAPFFTLYIPFTYTVWFILGLFSQSAGLFHLANVMLHLGSTLFVFLILVEIFELEIPALAGALLFALHPVQVEAVTWISGLKDCLFGFLALGAIYFYLLRIQKKREIATWFLCLLTLLSILSKPTGAILPLIFLTLRRFSLKESWVKSTRSIIPFLVIVLPIAILTKDVQPNFQVKDLAAFWFRPVVALHSIGFYLKQVLIPTSFSLDYGRSPRWVFNNGWQDLFVAFPLIGLGYLFYRFKNNRHIVFALLILILPLLPVCGIIPFQFQIFSTVADRYFYLSMFGVAFLFTYAVSQIKNKTPVVQCFLFIFILSLFSLRQTYQWRTNESIFNLTIQQNPKSFLARNNLAYELFENHRYKEAADQLRIVTKLRPEEIDLFLNYSAALAKSGQGTEAVSVLQEVLRRNPNHTQAQRLLSQLEPKS